MRAFLIAAAVIALPMAASAACFGSGAFQNCTDNQGNSYSVQRYGNTTQMQGYNAQHGTNWNQTSNTVGNVTFHNGTAANGNSWSGISTSIGGSTFYQGMDSRGKATARPATLSAAIK